MSVLAWASALTLFATWALYPACIWLLARLVGAGRRLANGPWPSPPSVSIVLATREDPEAVRARVTDLLQADYDSTRVEVVVAWDVDGPVAELPALRYSDERVREVRGDPPGGKSCNLNAGVRAARGQILVFADTKQRFSPDAVRLLVEALRDERVGAVSGLLSSESESAPTAAELYWRLERWLRREEAAVHSAVGVTGAIYAMRREAWKPLPESLLLDDLFTPMRLVLGGYRVGYCPGAQAIDARRFGPAEEFRRKVRTLTGVVQLCAWLPAVLVPFRNPIWLQFVAHKLLRLLTPYALLGLCLTGAFWLWTLAGRTELLMLAAAILALLVMVLASPHRRARVRELAVNGIAVQLAVVVATFNGIRGRWDVWRR